MNIVGVADTHAVLWNLYNDPRLSPPAATFIDFAADSGQKIGVSAVSVVEVVYLVEKRRLPKDAYQVLVEALANPDHVFTELPFTVAMAAAMRSITRQELPDMPDRMIAATAVALSMPLLSRDGKIRISGISTIW